MTGDGTRTSLERMGSHQLRPIKKSTLDKKKRLESIRRHKNVTVIQAIWRGHRARKISPFCADSSLASVSGNNQIDHNNDNSNGFGFMPNNLSSIPHNPEAKTTYLFPQHDNQKDDEENQSRENTEGFLKEPIHVGDGEAKDLIHLAEKKKEEEENHLKQGVIAVIMLGVYFLCATVLYSKMLKISYFHALYFCVVTVTTIGFGDISPHEDVPKLLTTVAIFAGLATFTIGITFLLDFFAKEKERLDELLISRKFEAENKIEMDVKCGVDISEDEDNEESCDANESFEIMSGRSASLCSRVVNRIPALIREALSSMLMAVLTIVVTVVLGAIFFMFVVDSMDFVDAVYFCAVIISSVGFGTLIDCVEPHQCSDEARPIRSDCAHSPRSPPPPTHVSVAGDIVPQSDRARLFVIFYGILGTGMTANALSKFSAGMICSSVGLCA